jgi:ASC-1-like (ASCH) protein
MHHVAILHSEYVDAILSGEKTIESRLSVVRGAPFGKVEPGDVIHFKRSGGGFGAAAHVSGVMSFEDLRPADVRMLAKRYGAQVAAPESYWTERLESRFATFIMLSGVKASVAVPAGFAPTPGARSAWYVLERAEAVRRTA